MGKADVVTKVYMRKSSIFADAFNYLIYNGQKKIQPDKLREVDITELAVFPDSVSDDMRQAETKQRYRDVLKSAVVVEDEKAAYVLLGVENQTDIHYAMPVRNMIYDALQYGKQVDNIAEMNRRRRKVQPSEKTKSGIQGREYLPGFGKMDKILPVITLVIHFGAERWDGPTSLREMFVETDASLMEFIQDYKIHLIDPARLSDEELQKFHSSLGDVLGYIKHSKTKEELKTYLVANDRMALEIDAIHVLQVLTGTPVEEEKGEETMELCGALKEWSEEERSEGRLEGKMSVLIEFVKEGYISVTEAARRAGLKENEFRQKMDEASHFIS